MMALIWQLFWTFFVTGLFTFGGGYAIMSLIQAQMVSGLGWISDATFTDIVAISQMTPGPVGLNCSTYVGYEVMRNAGYGEFAGTLGSLTASVAVVLPSFLVVLAIAHFYARFHENALFKGAMDALKPAVAGMIGAAAIAMIFKIDLSGSSQVLTLLQENFPDWKSWCLFAAAFLSYLKFKADPLVILFAGGVAGFLLY